jgi:hypothetical protein
VKERRSSSLSGRAYLIIVFMHFRNGIGEHMIIVSREEFSKMPDGTVYYLYSDLGLRGLGVKVGSMEVDASSQAWSHIDIESPKIEDRLTFCDQAWTQQFSTSQMFAVLEPLEVRRLVKILGGDM